MSDVYNKSFFITSLHQFFLVFFHQFNTSKKWHSIVRFMLGYIFSFFIMSNPFNIFGQSASPVGGNATPSALAIGRFAGTDCAMAGNGFKSMASHSYNRQSRAAKYRCRFVFLFFFIKRLFHLLSISHFCLRISWIIEW